MHLTVKEGPAEGEATLHPTQGLHAHHDNYSPGAVTTRFSATFFFELHNYNEFRFSDYKIFFRTCKPFDCNIGPVLVNDWNEPLNDSGSLGTIVFGSKDDPTLNIGEDGSFSMPYSTDGEIILSDELGVFKVEGTPSNFQFGLGESGSGQEERVEIWTSGSIWFRQNPN